MADQGAGQGNPRPLSSRKAASQLTDGIDEQESDVTWFENLDGVGHTWAQHDLDVDVTGEIKHDLDVDVTIEHDLTVDLTVEFDLDLDVDMRSQDDDS